MDPVGITESLVRDLEDRHRFPLSGGVARIARQCLLDWIGCAIAARDEPALQLLVRTLSIGDFGEFPVIAQRQRLSLGASVLANGTAGHALDYDDVHPVMGHPSVPVIPAALALGHQLKADGGALERAIVTGIEIECRIADWVGPSHYEIGWHSTATFGTFGAAAAACQLLGLDADKTRMAFGIAASRAAGLKSMFGTMTKPFQVGHAAQAGLYAALLAANGYTANEAALETPQGFAATQSHDWESRRAALPASEGTYLSGIVFKYHAACFLTHSAIEATRQLVQTHALRAEDVQHVSILVDPMHMSVCNIEKPMTGLELKFSLRAAVGLVFLGVNTADIAVYHDGQAVRDDLQQLMARMEVHPLGKRTNSTVRIATRDGREYSTSVDSEAAETDLERQQARLEGKFRALAVPILGSERSDRLIAACARLPELNDVSEIWELLKPA